jgi:hypothetical protein
MEMVSAVPVAGQPLAYALGVVALALIAFAGPMAQYLVTLAHEGGHYAVSILVGYRPNSLKIEDNGEGGTGYEADWWSPGRIVRLSAGYASPPLLGLGGAHLIASGKAWSVLWIALALLFTAFLIGTNGLAILVPLLAIGGISWAIIEGTPVVQAAVAVGLVWLLLLGGLRNAVEIPRSNDTTDVAKLTRDSLIIPRIFWHVGFVALAALCLWQGTRALLLI